MKILVSACLLGENCKYSGGNNYNQAVLPSQEMPCSASFRRAGG